MKATRLLKLTSLISLLGVFLFSLSGCKPLDNFINSVVFSDKIVKYDYDEININERPISVSKGKIDDGTFTIEDRGIIFNKNNLGKINNISFNITEKNFKAANIYFATTPLGFDEVHPLTVGQNNITPSIECGYFVIQAEGYPVTIKNLSFSTGEMLEDVEDHLPTISINTLNSQVVRSKTNYVTCYVSTSSESFEDVTSVPGQIKVRGNSTSKRPKLPYRIKFETKTSILGYEEAKNYVLLADFMDASRIHNYAALTFSQLVHDDSEFNVTPTHVKLKINGEYQGLYLLCEHVDEKKAHLDINQKEIWSKSFADLNFALERDIKDKEDRTKVEGEDYFSIGGHTFSVKYPKKDDFVETQLDGLTIAHEEAFKSYINNLKDYLAEICDLFKEYAKNINKFEEVSSKVDVDSLMKYSLVDQLMNEREHQTNSYKFYKVNHQKLKFGPNWDYDSQVFGLNYLGYYYPDPFTNGEFNSKNITDPWGHALYSDGVNGLPLFKAKWNSLGQNTLNNYYQELLVHAKEISHMMILETKMWIDNNYCVTFDNTRYSFLYLNSQIKYLNSVYA